MSEKVMMEPTDGSGAFLTNEKTLKFVANETMRAKLKTVAEIAEAALANQPNEDGPCWRALSKAIGELRKAMRPEPGTLAFMDESAWFEKKMDELRAKYGAGSLELGAESLKLGGNSHAEAQSRREENPWKPLEIPECGIDFRRYYSKDCEVYICAWKDGQGNISHVYEVRCRKVEEGKWVAEGSNDGRKLFAMIVPSRQLSYRFALGAMRDYLRRGHRKTIRKAKKAAADAAQEVAE